MREPPRTCPLLLDTNVWLDYLFYDRKRHDEAFQLVDECCQHDIELLYSTASTKDVYCMAQAHLKRAHRLACGTDLSESDARAVQRFAWSCIDQMEELGTAVGCDASDMWYACRQRPIHGDYEDDLILAAVHRASSALLVTNDEKLLRHCPVAALDVADALAYIRQDDGRDR